MSRRPSAASMKRACAKWNKANPVGCAVRYWPGFRGADHDPKESTTITEAQVLGGHTAGVYLAGGVGFVALSHVEASSWELSGVSVCVKENERGGSQHAKFVLGAKVVTFIVVAMKQNADHPAYVFADWTRPNGGSDRTYGDKSAIRINGDASPDDVIGMLLGGLRDGTIPSISPNAEANS